MASDRDFIQILDAALAEAAARSGPWLVCKPGCFECCIGPFPISQLDARRLREGLAGLDRTDALRAARVRDRSRAAIARIGAAYPGDRATGILEEDGENRFPDSEDDHPCPVLDPETGTCDLYAARPVTCRTFGPAMRWGGESLGVCELCYHGATDTQIAACEVQVDASTRESELLADLGDSTQTTVAFAIITER